MASEEMIFEYFFSNLAFRYQSNSEVCTKMLYLVKDYSRNISVKLLSKYLQNISCATVSCHSNQISYPIGIKKPEDHWSCIAHLIAEDMLKSAVIEEKTFKHSPWAGADNPLGPKF